MIKTHSELFNDTSYFEYYYYQIDWNWQSWGGKMCGGLYLRCRFSPYGPEFCFQMLWWILSFLVSSYPPYVWDLGSLPTSWAHPHLVQRAQWDCLRPHVPRQARQPVLLDLDSANDINLSRSPQLKGQQIFSYVIFRRLIICTSRPSINLKLIFEYAVR